MYVFQLFDYYSASRIVLVVAFFECLVVSYIYGMFPSRNSSTTQFLNLYRIFWGIFFLENFAWKKNFGKENVYIPVEEFLLLAALIIFLNPQNKSPFRQPPTPVFWAVTHFAIIKVIA